MSHTAGLVVYGASGHGREVMSWVEAAGRAPDVLGFVDDDPATHGTRRVGHVVQGGFEWLERTAADGSVDVVLGLGAPDVKSRLVERLRPLGVSFPVIVHPAAVVTPHVTVGEGVTVAAGCIISVDVTLGEFTSFGHACTIAHDAVIGAYATVLPGANVSGNVTVSEGVLLGADATVIQGVTIGRNTIVGAGATVVRDLPADCTAVGTPAVPLNR
jgi:sugar O-acyltransferase (sialic acid O-acetyltransferase NeuD family)